MSELGNTSGQEPATPPAAPTTRHRRNIAIWFFGALGGILWGYDTGVIGGALLFIDKDIIPNPLIEGMVVSGLLLGAMIGAMGSGRLSDRLGRKKLIVAGAVVFIVGTAGAALAVNSALLILFRMVIGLGVGIVSVVVPMYLSELAPKNIRGALSSLMPLMVTTGIFLAYLVALLNAQPHNYSEELREPDGPPRPRILRLAEESIELRFAEPLTVTDLARDAGVSVRRLQETFAQFHGTSPKAFLTDFRLDQARRALLAGQGTVTEVAQDCGFTHLSRFAASYRDRFGELPSETRARVVL